MDTVSLFEALDHVALVRGSQRGGITRILCFRVAVCASYVPVQLQYVPLQFFAYPDDIPRVCSGGIPYSRCRQAGCVRVHHGPAASPWQSGRVRRCTARASCGGGGAGRPGRPDGVLIARRPGVSGDVQPQGTQSPHASYAIRWLCLCIVLSPFMRYEERAWPDCRLHGYWHKYYDNGYILGYIRPKFGFKRTLNRSSLLRKGRWL